MTEIKQIIEIQLSTNGMRNMTRHFILLSKGNLEKRNFNPDQFNGQVIERR